MQYINYLTKDGLVFASAAVVADEALASSISVVANTATRAISTIESAISLEDICARGALHQGTVGASATQIAHASNVFRGVPGLGVHATSLHRQLLLGEAHARLATGIGAHSALAGNALVVLEALALAAGSVAHTLVGALSHRVGVIGAHNITNPSGVFGASAAGAVAEGPGGLSVDARIAGALVVSSTRAVTAASVWAMGRHEGEHRSEYQSGEHRR